MTILNELGGSERGKFTEYTVSECQLWSNTNFGF